MEFKITDEITRHDKEEIFKGLLAYNLAKIEDKNPKELGIYYEDSDGRKLAGLIGETHGNWLTVEFLWVSEELRGQHIGSRLLREAEKEASAQSSKFFRKPSFKHLERVQYFGFLCYK